MKRVLRTFFFFSKRERIGVLCLLTLLLTAFLVPRIYAFFKSEAVVDFAEFDEAIALLERRQNIDADKSSNNTFTNQRKQHNQPDKDFQLFTFDPNTLSKDSFELLGLSPKLANTIINYRNKGGKFYNPEGFKKMYGLSAEQFLELRPYIHITAFGKPTPVYASNHSKKTNKDIQLQTFDPNTATKEELSILGFTSKVSQTLLNFRDKGGLFFKKEDLKKIYGLSNEQYLQLEPYITIAEETIAYNNTPTSYNNNSERIETQDVNLKKTVKIDINHSSTEDWQQLRGIGPAYAKRITKFRDKLGGFSSVNQIAETYGLPDSTFQKIRPFLEPSSVLRKIFINSSDVKTLAAHPYINFQLAKVIVAYREQHGPFVGVEDLKEIVLLEESDLKKISPYISFE